MKPLAVSCLAAAALAAAPSQAGADEAPALAEKHRCLACHQIDAKSVGPAFREVAKRYKDDAAAQDKLVQKVKAGGRGNWGKVPMPANDLTEGDLRTLVRWVLGMGAA
jgi:cytochrome c